ncbi:hypothetical protein HDV57DRAFT_401924 [Trichoderma longibrachiatum]|uniref:Uncharacterized protein n=1 Tax=Trichoderma longibrachiatum ATCC 18648 TaxID=983965 RepID=A0A2T4C1X8_TRILO|nr:hypothetical protein M440DRAFT_1256444 [Trichoderma longibrachiatum ATCC 18648]
MHTETCQEPFVRHDARGSLCRERFWGRKAVRILLALRRTTAFEAATARMAEIGVSDSAFRSGAIDHCLASCRDAVPPCPHASLGQPGRRTRAEAEVTECAGVAHSMDRHVTEKGEINTAAALRTKPSERSSGWRLAKPQTVLRLSLNPCLAG